MGATTTERGCHTMASRVITELTDDLDGGKAHQTVPFSLDGITYEIDLSDTNADRMRAALATFTGNARKVSGRRTGPQRPATVVLVPGGKKKTAKGDGPVPSVVRRWAIANGIDLSPRGRIPGSVIERYLFAGGKTATAPATPTETAEVPAAVAAELVDDPGTAGAPVPTFSDTPKDTGKVAAAARENQRAKARGTAKTTVKKATTAKAAAARTGTRKAAAKKRAGS